MSSDTITLCEATAEITKSTPSATNASHTSLSNDGAGTALLHADRKPTDYEMVRVAP